MRQPFSLTSLLFLRFALIWRYYATIFPTKLCHQRESNPRQQSCTMFQDALPTELLKDNCSLQGAGTLKLFY